MSSVCLPGSGGDGADVARSLSALECWRRVRGAAQPELDPDGRRYVRTVLDLCESAGPFGQAALFDPLPAAMDAPRTASFDDGTADSRDPARRALAAGRYCIGSGVLGDFTLALPPSAGGGGPVYFPALNALARPGPAVVVSRNGTTRVTWGDGSVMTAPNGRQLPACEYAHVRALPAVHGIPVLNEVPEVAAACEPFDLCPEEETRAAAERIRDGFELLESVWPQAYGSVLRHAKGLVVLRKRPYSRSHSPERLQGAVLLTPEDAVVVADLLTHEVSHIRLNLMREFDPLWEDTQPGKLHSSPWRQDPRPLKGLVLGVHAFLNVCHFYRRVEGGEGVFERQRSKVRQGWETARPLLKPTPLGREFIEELEREVRAL